MTRPTLTALVVTHNRLKPLQVTVNRLLGSEAVTDLVVVDNASRQETHDWLAERAREDSRLTVLRNDRNGGGAMGFQTGLAYVRDELDSDWTVIMDDDARPYDGALSKFLSVERDPSTCYAAAVYLPNGGICEMNRPGRNPFWHGDVFWKTFTGVFQGRGRAAFHLPDAAFEDTSLHEVDTTSFVGLFIPRKTLKETGLPDGRLFLYGDDVIYALKHRKEGGRILFDPQISFEHDFTTSTEAAPDVLTPIWKVYYIQRNSLIMYRQASGPAFWAVLPLVVLKWFAKVRHYGHNRALYLGLFWRAVRDGLTGRLTMDHDHLLAFVRGDRTSKI